MTKHVDMDEFLKHARDPTWWQTKMHKHLRDGKDLRVIFDPPRRPSTPLVPGIRYACPCGELDRFRARAEAAGFKLVEIPLDSEAVAAFEIKPT